MYWRTKTFGKITGGQLEGILAGFGGYWEQHSTLPPSSTMEEAFKRIAKLAAVPSWLGFYERPLVELAAYAAAITGTSEAIRVASAAADPYAAVSDVIANIPEEAAEHPLALPLSFALVANLEAIARYSRSINEMIISARERGDLEALSHALSIDSALLAMPLCQAMLKYGQLTGDDLFAKVVFKAIRGPHKKRLAFPKLRWAEYILRDRNAFRECTEDELFELLVVHLRLYPDDTERKDAKKALFAMFRKWREEPGN